MPTQQNICAIDPAAAKFEYLAARIGLPVSASLILGSLLLLTRP
jgi:hypothetical protein